MKELTKDDILKLQGLKALATEHNLFLAQVRTMANKICGEEATGYGWASEYLDDERNDIPWLLERLAKD